MNQFNDKLQENVERYKKECDSKGLTPDNPEVKEKHGSVLIKAAIIFHECLFAEHLLTPELPLEKLLVHQKHKEDLIKSFSEQDSEFYDLNCTDFYKPSRRGEDFAVLFSPLNSQKILTSYVEQLYLGDYEERATWVRQHFPMV